MNGPTPGPRSSLRLFKLIPHSVEDQPTADGTPAFRHGRSNRPGIFPRFRRHWITSTVLGALRFIVNRGAVAKPRVQTHPVVVGEVAAQEAAHVAGAREADAVDDVGLH